MHTARYLFKLFFGYMIIVALSVLLKEIDPDSDGWWLFISLALYNGYCYIDYRIEDKK